MNLENVLDMLRNGTGLRTHSARVQAGDVFVALSGTKVDGARFIDDAVARGVRCGEIPAHRIGGAIRIFWGEATKESATGGRWRGK